MDGMDVVGLEVEDVFRRNLAVRAETLESKLPRADELSVENVRMLAASKRLGASSDFTDENVLLVITDAVSLSDPESSLALAIALLDAP